MAAPRATLGSIGAWRSLVAHLLWEQGVAGSNPVAPTGDGIPSLLVAIRLAEGYGERTVGVFSRLISAAESQVNGPPKPPPHAWPAGQAWARVLSSERDPGSRSGRYRSEGPSMLDDVIDRTRGIPYRFELEVHRPDRPAYESVREERVPGKVEGTLFLKSHKIPAGVEVPLQLNDTGDEDFEIDWDAYLAIPHQADRAYHLRIEAAREFQARRNG